MEANGRKNGIGIFSLIVFIALHNNTTILQDLTYYQLVRVL